MKRLFVDLEICNNCKDCTVCCDYFYHPQNNGITSLREYATFATICRHCEEAPCVAACYHNALERPSTPLGTSSSERSESNGRSSDGHLKRYKMRCSSCKSCTVACPFGIIFQDFIPYLDSQCDYCIGISGKLPKCVTSCPEKAIEIKEVAEDLEKDIYFVGEHLAVHTLKWSREDYRP